MTGSTGPFTASADWTWLSTAVLDGGFDEDADAEFAPGARLLRRPEHTVHLRAAYDAGEALMLSADARFVGARVDRDFAMSPAARVDLARYTTVGVSAEVRLPGGQAGLPPTALTLRAENLFDEHYQEVLGFDAPGRALVVGARVSLGGAR
jgi:vitamin B12 transporter